MFLLISNHDIKNGNGKFVKKKLNICTLQVQNIYMFKYYTVQYLIKFNKKKNNITIHRTILKL